MIDGKPCRSIAAAGCLALLVACGGGGGGGAAPPAPPPPPPPPAVSGLVPAAPTPGAVLLADAARLEPDIDGAAWHYQGSYRENPFAQPVVYETRRTLTVRADRSVEVNDSNSLNAGPDVETGTLVDGQVILSYATNLSGRAVETYSTPVLRSPVRAGDQYTILDRRYTDTDLDADNDGKFDVIEVGFYLRVVGMETVDLPVIGNVQAIRIDTVALQRVQYSSDNSYSRVFESIGKGWYLPGVGEVRGRLETSRASGGYEVYEQTLSYWDGVDTGLGRSPTQSPDVASLAGRFSGFRQPVAHAFAGHALLFGIAETASGAGLAALAVRYDRRGTPQGSVLAGWNDVATWLDAVPVRDGLVVVGSRPDLSNAVVFGQTDASGNRRGGADMVAVGLGGSRLVPQVSRVQVAGDDTRVWLVWDRLYRDTDPAFSIRNELVVQPFSPEGVPLAAESTIPVASMPGSRTLSARGGRLLLSWLEGSSETQLRMAVIDASGSGAVARAPYAVDLRPGAQMLQPLLFDSGGALLWFHNGFPGPNVETYGLRLDGGFAARPAGASPEADRLAGLLSPPRGSATGSLLRESLGNRLLMLLAEPPADPQLAAGRVMWIDSTPDQPLATSAQKSVPFQWGATLPHTMAVYTDRVLLFTGTTGAVLWLRTPGD